jgi:Ser/Thr protein kinase RdoA (MazF antagonist)
MQEIDPELGQKQFDEVNPQERIGYTGNLEPVIAEIAQKYGIGDTTDFDILTTGYEDCNVRITANGKQYIAKMFAAHRQPEEIERYVTIIRAAVDGGVHHPNMHSANGADILRTKEGITLAFLDFVEGETFMELDRLPTYEERLKTLEQAARINNLDFHPPFLFDSWAVQHMSAAYQEVKPFLHEDDLNILEEAERMFAAVPQDELPHAFVHGDLTKSNVLLGKDSEIHILDLSVSNWYPRIQDLSVIIANLLNDPSSQIPLKEVMQKVAEEYRQFGTLTDEEIEYLYPYTIGAVAMEFIGGNREKYLKKSNSEETNYWLELGRSGLHRALGKEK